VAWGPAARWSAHQEIIAPVPPLAQSGFVAPARLYDVDQRAVAPAALPAPRSLHSQPVVVEFPHGAHACRQCRAIG
jgi:hypothetical protein